MNIRIGRKIALLASVSVLSVTPAYTQDPASAEEEKIVEEVIVVGSQIKGSKISGTLPVSVMSKEDIEVMGVADGDDLYRNIPQAGFVNFHAQDTSGGVNGVRGDAGAINLRGLGTGNTLMLINGRRMVLHPGFKTELLVPVVSPNTNTIPAFGVGRVEVLRDGAAALYGADAVAGVVNTVLDDDYDGLAVSARYGWATTNPRRDINANIKWGSDFNNGASHVAIFANYSHRNKVHTSELAQAASYDRRLLPNDPDFVGDLSFDNRSTSTPWGYFDVVQSGRVELADGTDLTNSSGRFHIAPDINSGCRVNLGGGLCIDDSGPSSTSDRNIRYDLAPAMTWMPERDRFNISSMWTHEVNENVELYGEASYYRSETEREREKKAILSSARIVVPASNYWNPFGAEFLADGVTPNPNRIANLDPSDVGPDGVDIRLRQYRPIDAGPMTGNVKGESFRLLAGARGDWGDWSWDTAVMHSEASTNDVTHNRTSSTLFQQALALNTPDAYNPFNGADLDNYSLDSSGNSQATMDSFSIDVFRKGKTKLSLIDFKISNPSVFTIPGGDIGAAIGIEGRRESFSDDRDDRLDGTTIFTDMVTGEVSISDVMGSSPTPDTQGSRNVLSSFAELAVPLISPDMEIPLMDSFDVQLAARYENIQHTGDTVKPKIAASWSVVPGLMFRGAWSKGFRAPNLVQIFDTGIRRSNTRDDYVICQAQVEKGDISSLSACSGQSTESRRFGTDELKAEQTTNKTIGVVFAPEAADGLTITIDYWKIEQEGIVGIFGDGNQIALDLLRRIQGSTNPNVVRYDPDLGQIELFDGTSLDVAGEVHYVLDPYKNLQKRQVSGLDFALLYSIDTDAGNFDFKINAAKLNSFNQDPGPDGQELIDAFESGLLPDDVIPSGIGDLKGRNGRPDWRYTASLRWRKDNFGAGVFVRHVGEFFESSVTQNDTGEYWHIDSWTTVNASIDYSIQNDSFLDGTRLKFGINNIADKHAPLADESFGYFGGLHTGGGRSMYINISKKF